ncbi:secreted protein [Streptomyces lincolnensis]|uniref:Secreted protein n=1 Tax=Streptomyces lincolnensis TaxID=1915 RepID=A0A1B1M3J2_STRLN|nr:class F sortase [Streptomyces lincolnensis]ANS63229.1 secreted protein [Streptomyces lincolnensis]AXG52152.1 secreted protein [Streptomyces lincolnensis]QMV05128.1 class F sortase [Streptomyces lincolnensis]
MAASPPSPTATDPTPARSRSRTVATVLWSALALLLVVSLFAGEDESSDGGPAPHAAPAAASASPPARPLGKHLPRSRPVRLLIPDISVDAPFTALAIGRSGQLQPPPADDTNLVGWYAEGVSPGQAGTSIIAGHVDTATSAAVFADLGELEKGDRFHVLRADRRKATFAVDSVETFDKDHFPSDRVYADTPRAQVRLITCAGDYDRRVKDYTANLVVFAHLI